MVRTYLGTCKVEFTTVAENCVWQHNLQLTARLLKNRAHTPKPLWITRLCVDTKFNV